MPLSLCNSITDEQGRELTQHGTAAFPFACYHDDLKKEDVPWHWHDELEAVVVSQGETSVTIGSQSHIIPKGCGFFVNSGVLHDCYNHGSDSCRFHSLVFHPRLIGGSSGSIFWQRYVQPLVSDTSFEGLFLDAAVPWQSKCLEDIEAAWQAGASNASGYEFRVRSALSDLIFMLCDQRSAAPALSSEKALRDRNRIKKMLAYIQEHFDRDLTVKEIACHASLSESECLRCFQKTIGTSPIRYLKDYRIQQAAGLLSGTTLSITEIATGCGFSDMSYFAKSFKEIRGCTPTYFRRNASPK